MDGRMQKSRVALMALLLILFAGCGKAVESYAPVRLAEPIDPERTDGAENADGAGDTDGGEDVYGTGEKAGEEGTAAPEEQDMAETVISVTISAAGDVTLGNHKNQEYAYSFRQMYDETGPEYFFQNVSALFGEDDMTIVNFEGVLTYAEEVQEKEYNMKGDPSYIRILSEGNVEAVSFGNNHRLDYLARGSEDTVAVFESAGIVYAYENITGVYETGQGIRIGIVSVNGVGRGEAVEPIILNGITQLREDEADLVIVCCHWGVERENYPEEYQQTLGRKCIDWGADLVLGCHPHVLQGVELYKGRFIVYSLANFCFGGNRNPADKDTMIFQQTFTFCDGVLQEDVCARVVPCSVSSVATRNDFCPTPSEGEEFDRILERINEYSLPYGVLFDKDGYYVCD